MHTLSILDLSRFEQTVWYSNTINPENCSTSSFASSEFLNAFYTCWNTGRRHWLLANIELGRQRRETWGEGVRETDHSAFSDEPDACCYADHREGNGKRRERESRVETSRGGKVWTPAWIEFSSLRSGWSTGERSLWKEQNAMECLEEDQGRKKARSWGGGKGPIFTFLTLLISDASLSQHDSASFITFRVCLCVRACVCVFVACLNRNKFSLNWHCALLANSWSARKICN